MNFTYSQYPGIHESRPTLFNNFKLPRMFTKPIVHTVNKFTFFSLEFCASSKSDKIIFITLYYLLNAKYNISQSMHKNSQFDRL